VAAREARVIPMDPRMNAMESRVTPKKSAVNGRESTMIPLHSSLTTSLEVINTLRFSKENPYCARI
jgi:hypothetical protein